MYLFNISFISDLEDTAAGQKRYGRDIVVEEGSPLGPTLRQPAHRRPEKADTLFLYATVDSEFAHEFLTRFR